MGRCNPLGEKIRARHCDRTRADAKTNARSLSRAIDPDVLDHLRLSEEQPLACLQAVTPLSLLLHL